ncbi:hypothetical protein ACK4CS_07075 [Enterococcus gallinarum]|uniref:hypothetical protein n=1 Tax=Enterococcus gallinarum TaxID=1353 RepID=UPI001114866B|nr:hypothetical protein [Enterococcus gallinarum]
MEEIFFCMIVEFLFVSIGFLIMGFSNMMYLFPFDSKAECIFSSIIIFFILACVWIVAREIYHQFVLEDGKGIIAWFLQKRK